MLLLHCIVDDMIGKAFPLLCNALLLLLHGLDLLPIVSLLEQRPIQYSPRFSSGLLGGLSDGCYGIRHLVYQQLHHLSHTVRWRPNELM